MPVLGDVAQVLPPVADGGVGDVLPAEGGRAAGAFLQPRQAVDQLGLAVAVDAGDAQDLPGPHVEADVVHGVALVGLGGDAEVPQGQHRLPGLGGLLVDLQLDGAAHHHVGQGLLVRVLGVHGADVPALAQHRHPVGHLHDLVELVGDEQDGLALLGELLHGGHQLVDLLGGEDGGGLVEDEDFVVPVQHLEDLHPLLHPHGDVLHPGVQVHLQAVPLGQGLHLGPGLLLLEEARLCGLRAQNDVVQHGEHLNELEVLVDHADAQGRGVVGVVDPHRLAVLPDFALLRLVQAEQHAHQRGLARAVFPQQGVDLPPPQLERDVVVGDDTGELLGDVQHLNDVFRIHGSPPASLS